jgi:predicted nucleotidyltransferase component of viral defense system
MQIPTLENFYLVGGTNLSLRYGHRLSLDLDLFSTKPFDNDFIKEEIEKYFPSFAANSTKNPIGLFGFIDNIKVDFVKHDKFLLVDKIVEEDGIRMFSDKDIIAMKIFAILQRAVKKDFWDIALLLKKYSLETCIEYYQKKYLSNQMLISIPHALLYFEDAEQSEEPISLQNQTWESIKKEIKKHIQAYLKK